VITNWFFLVDPYITIDVWLLILFAMDIAIGSLCALLLKRTIYRDDDEGFRDMFLPNMIIWWCIILLFAFFHFLTYANPMQIVADFLRGISYAVVSLYLLPTPEYEVQEQLHFSHERKTL